VDLAWFTARQNPDGGWGYATDGSATEPTAFALLALSALDVIRRDAWRRGLLWLAKSQRSDGGWPPRPNIAQSTWVTALALLVSCDTGKKPSGSHCNADAATQWLIRQSGRESSLAEQLKSVLLGFKPDMDVSNEGWPWFPGAAAWVMPTSLTLLALRKRQALKPDPRVADRISEAQDFLLARRCADGGWNHGATKALGYEARSYPETTGMAMLALRGVQPDALAASLQTAQRHLAATRSREAANWLRLGLAAHGVKTPPKQFAREAATVQEAAIACLADAAVQGRNLFLP
jgi:hypothetical protein